jgi:hypothetical protein
MTTKEMMPDDEIEFDLSYPAVDDTLIKYKTGERYIVGYLCCDDTAIYPDENDEDENLFLVNYHRDFDVRRDKIITERDARNWWREDYTDYYEEDENGNPIKMLNIPQSEKYWTFPLTCYVHSGVRLYIGDGRLPFDSQGWDTSHVGMVLVAKSEWTEEADAEKAAHGLVETWNQYLSGDVYGVIVEVMDETGAPIDDEKDSCWGYYGFDYANQSLSELMQCKKEQFEKEEAEYRRVAGVQLELFPL